MRRTHCVKVKKNKILVLLNDFLKSRTVCIALLERISAHIMVLLSSANFCPFFDAAIAKFEDMKKKVKVKDIQCKVAQLWRYKFD